MSLSWRQRKARLATLLNVTGLGEEEEGRAVDRILHGQSVIGKTAKTIEVDKLRFQDKDLDVVGTLAYGQFGVIDVVNCRLNNRVYVRKSIEKRFALRTRDQCFPLHEKHLLLSALTSNSHWAPHLLCAFQTPTKLCFLMDYAEGGTLWDVLESSPLDGKIKENDLKWWIPQAVSAIAWCHEQGFAHRDIKPHNFVLTPASHVQLIDFGSAAPLLPESQRLPKRYCLVPCGTCDYISPEILQAHEEALVALEMDDDEEELELLNGKKRDRQEGYGAETDWWSLGAMIYEMAYGVAPFYANDVKQTYLRIINYQKSLRFEATNKISSTLRDFLQRLLTDAAHRLGRNGIQEINDHPLFDDVNWSKLPFQKAPASLHLPQFTFTEAQVATAEQQEQGQTYDESLSQGFPFSAFFQSSSLMSHQMSNQTHGGNKDVSQGVSFVTHTPGTGPGNSMPKSSMKSPDDASSATVDTPKAEMKTPARLRIPSTHITPFPDTPLPGHHAHHPFSTPLRFNGGGTIPRSTVHRTAQRRMVSDREAMKMLVDCVGMSARKKVLESGRKPRVLTRSFSLSRNIGAKELRWDVMDPIPAPDYFESTSTIKGKKKMGGLVVDTRRKFGEGEGEQGLMFYQASASLSLSRSLSEPAIGVGVPGGETETETETESEGPPSPSPSPRPGSAMSCYPTVGGFSYSGRARSVTPTMSSSGFGSATPTTTVTRTSLSMTSGALRSLLSVPGTARRASFGDLVDLRRDGSGEDEIWGAGGVLPENDLRDEKPLKKKVVGEREVEQDKWKSGKKSAFDFEEMEKRHRAIMLELNSLEGRLKEVKKEANR
ncbi:kinase-like domain-containing protein [Cyathus striatus]|nr:kinase-like domain-containing protein [Cyathus striatus]